jgi:ABC-2 type transport system permease protein
VIGAAIRKDAQLLLRDRGSLLSLFLLPVIFMGVLGAMFSGGGSGSRRQTVAVTGAEANPLAARAARGLDESNLFRVRSEPSAVRVRQLVAAEEVSAGIIFPPDFDPAAGVPAELSIDLGASPQDRAPLQGALSGAVTSALYGAAAPPVLSPAAPPGIQRPLEAASPFQLFVPGSAVFFGFFLALTVGLSFVEERKTGTFRRLLAAPIRRSTVLWAKLVPYYLIGLVQMGFLFAVGILAFGLAVGGSWLALVLLTAALVFAAVALGLLIASLGGSERQIGAVGSICILVMGLLGGGMVPRLVMPDTMKAIGSITPHAWALDGYYDLLIREGRDLADVAPEIAALVAFGTAFAFAGVLRFRFERR